MKGKSLFNVHRLWVLVGVVPSLLLLLSGAVQGFAPTTLSLQRQEASKRPLVATLSPSAFSFRPNNKDPSRRQRQLEPRILSGPFSSTLLKATSEKPNDNTSDADENPTDAEEATLEERIARIDKDNDDDFQVYNPVPLFTGSLFLISSLCLCGYFIYAGLTGDDPLSGHPK